MRDVLTPAKKRHGDRPITADPRIPKEAPQLPRTQHSNCENAKIVQLGRRS